MVLRQPATFKRIRFGVTFVTNDVTASTDIFVQDIFRLFRFINASIILRMLHASKPTHMAKFSASNWVFLAISLHISSLMGTCSQLSSFRWRQRESNIFNEAFVIVAMLKSKYCNFASKLGSLSKNFSSKIGWVS